jgi:adenylate cyclase
MKPTPSPPSPELTLRAVRRLLEGVIPPAMCSVSEDGMPHVNYLSHAEYIDDDHVALTFQFFNRSRANVLATGRVALSVEDPTCGAGVMLELRYLRTDTEGPIFERLRAKLAGIAAHTGMEKVFHLRGADVYRVEGLELMDIRYGLPSLASRCDLAGGVRRLGQALAEAVDMAALLRTFLAGLETELRIGHAIVWMLDEQQQGLYSLGSIGYADPGTGAEMPLADAGLAGVAVREGVPIRIGHMTSQYDYALICRERAAQMGLEAVVQRMVPLPGLARPRSQLAVPLRARGRTVGALLVESDRDQFFGYDDEDALAAVGAQLALGLATLRANDAPDDKAAAAAMPAVVAPAPAQGPLLRMRHYPRDHSVFVGDEYLIRGVAGAILAKVVRNRIATGIDTFSTRELRLAGDDLRLPDVQDNLGVRLLLLERRLAERDFGLRIERVGRGRYRLLARGPLEISSGA